MCLANTILDASHASLHSILTKPFGIQSITSPILQMRKLRFTERISNSTRVTELVSGRSVILST